MMDVCPRSCRSHARPRRYSWSEDISAEVGSPNTGRSSLALTGLAARQQSNSSARCSNFNQYSMSNGQACDYNAVRLTINETLCMTDPIIDLQIDTSGLQCPMPLLKTRQALRHLNPGQVLEVIATDASSARDIPAYLGQSCHELVRCHEHPGRWVFQIRRGERES